MCAMLLLKWAGALLFSKTYCMFLTPFCLPWKRLSSEIKRCFFYLFHAEMNYAKWKFWTSERSTGGSSLWMPQESSIALLLIEFQRYCMTQGFAWLGDLNCEVNEGSFPVNYSVKFHIKRRPFPSVGNCKNTLTKECKARHLAATANQLNNRKGKKGAQLAEDNA